jgi:hypothetical protein
VAARGQGLAERDRREGVAGVAEGRDEDPQRHRVRARQGPRRRG